MKKIMAVILAFAVAASAAIWRFPTNVTMDSAKVYVASGDTAYTKKLSFSGNLHRIGKIAIVDTNMVDQDTINIGTGTTGGVKIFRRVCFPFGNLFGYDSTKFDTLCQKCGDTTNVPFINQHVLSGDSLIIAHIDTTQMKLTSVGGDSMWISKGYFVLDTDDPSPLTDFMVIGLSGLSTVKHKIVLMIWSF